MRPPFPSRALLLIAALPLFPERGHSQSIATPWSGHGHDPQHTAVSATAAVPMSAVRWQAPIDLAPQYTGTSLLIHYGSPLVTRANTVIFPVKTGSHDGFRVEARRGSDGLLQWMQTSDYSLPPHNWVPSFGMTLTPKNRLYFPGAGGTVLWRDTPDAATGSSGRLAFYGLASYVAEQANFDANVKINTPITSDRYGNIFFGFVVNGATNPALQGGIARISEDGTGSWIAAGAAAQGDSSVTKVAHNSAPALSNDHRTLYVSLNSGGFSSGWLVALDSRTLAPVARVRLKDALNTANDSMIPDEGTASPMVGPDGDVYFGVLESPLFSNHFRGWLLHFDSTLTQTKTPGAFGWDVTPSVVPASAVPSYTGTSKYLLLTKYNNYVEGGGDGVNRIAVLDPNDSQTDAVSGATVMKEVLTKAGPTPDPGNVSAAHPDAVREWCINTAAVDAAGRCAFVNNEDGKIYRWDFTTNTLIQAVTLTAGIGQAYTPTVIGVDGTVYAISNGVLFAVGEQP